MTIHSQIDQAVYEAAHDTAVFVDRSDLGLLKISGETRLDLIHRMSTQAVNGLKRGEGTATILTTDIGRIIDRLILYVDDDAVYALTSENNADNIARYLMRFVFFQDDFHLQDMSPDTAVFAIYGPQAGEKLVPVSSNQFSVISGLSPEVATLQKSERDLRRDVLTQIENLMRHHWQQAEIAGVDITIHRADPIAGDGYFLMCETSQKEALRQRLLKTGLVEADEAAFDFLRIEAGLPRFGYELTPDYIPLEANLWDDVSFNKGCYIGQEIIARMESRGRLAKRMVNLSPSAPVEAGAELTVNDKKAGSVTSAAVGPAGPVAIGFVKTAVLENNTLLHIGPITVTPG